MRVISEFSVRILETQVFGIPRSLSSSRTVKQRSSSIASRIRSIYSGVIVLESRPERGSLSTDSAAVFILLVLLFYLCFAHTFTPKGLLYHFNSFRTTYFEFKAKLDANSLFISLRHFQQWTKSDERKKRHYKQIHDARELTHPVCNCGSRRVREESLVTLVPHRGRSNVLVRSYERRSDTFRAHLVCLFISVIGEELTLCRLLYWPAHV